MIFGGMIAKCFITGLLSILNSLGLIKKAAGNDPATLNILLRINMEIVTPGFPVRVEISKEYL